MELKEDKNRIRLVVGWIVDIAVVISIAWFAVHGDGVHRYCKHDLADPSR